MKLVDTSVIVDHLRGSVAATALLEAWVDTDESLAASELTRFELLSGVRPAEQDALEALFSVFAWVPVTEDACRHAGAFARTYRRSHSGIGVVDYLLAGTAQTLGADLVTTNVRHFPMFDDLRAPYSDGSHKS
ncbi:MAG: type II toxin-antitoxin system VapC family toxin [Geodermatophilaceae bacterium]|nr:type II toxin-antitoxin system VapC family toxin [Geodermatophilaceae bacterium]MDQ3463228.1 type II toxin-antitoxin system VapC family toxin [Actinomycetota bacterium]